MDNSLISLLENISFTNKEARVYLALLELGQGDVTDIARVTELKRSIIYVILEGLLKRGHVSQVPVKKVNTYQAIDPSIILNTIKTTAKQFSEMIPILKTLENKGKRKPNISYIENKKGIWQIYEEVFQAKDVLMVSSYVRIDEYFPGALSKWVGDYKKGIYILRGKHLLPDNPDEIVIGRKLVEAKQEVRYLKELRGMSMDFIMYNNKLAITSLDEEPFMVVIKSEGLMKSMRAMFEINWQNAKTINKKNKSLNSEIKLA